MNKKGFTLVELLATLTILVLMSLIVGVNITSIMESTDDMEDTSRKEKIANAACVFVDSSVNTNLCKTQQTTSCTDIKVTDLTSAGLLGNDIRKLISEGSIPNNKIKVCYKNNEKICEYDCTEDCECP